MGVLRGTIAVINGGNSGIGHATATRVASKGGFVSVTGRRQDELDKAVKAIGKNASGVGVKSETKQEHNPAGFMALDALGHANVFEVARRR